MLCSSIQQQTTNYHNNIKALNAQLMSMLQQHDKLHSQSIQTNSMTTTFFTCTQSQLAPQAYTNMGEHRNVCNGAKSNYPFFLSLPHLLQVLSTSSALLEPCVPPPLNYLQFCAIIFHSAHVLFTFLLPPPGTRFHRMSVNVHLLLVFGATSKHTISVLPSPPSDT